MAAPRTNAGPLISPLTKPVFSPPLSSQKPPAKSSAKMMPPSPLAALGSSAPVAKKAPVRTALQFQTSASSAAATSAPAASAATSAPAASTAKSNSAATSSPAANAAKPSAVAASPAHPSNAQPEPPTVPKLVIKSESGSLTTTTVPLIPGTHNVVPSNGATASKENGIKEQATQTPVSIGVSGPNRMTALELEEAKRNRSPYRCNKCGQPKRGHVCTLTLALTSNADTASFPGAAMPVLEAPSDVERELDEQQPNRTTARSPVVPVAPTGNAGPALPTALPTAELDGKPAVALNRGSSIQTAGISATTFYTNWFDMAMSNLEILRSNLRSAEKLRVWDRYGECSGTVADTLFKLKDLRDSLATTLNELKEKEPGYLQQIEVPLPAPPPKLTDDVPQMSASPLKKTKPPAPPQLPPAAPAGGKSSKKRRSTIPGSDDSIEKTERPKPKRSRARRQREKKEDSPPLPVATRKQRKSRKLEIADEGSAATSEADSSAGDSDERAALEGMLSIQSSQRSAADELDEEAGAGGSQPRSSSQQPGAPESQPMSAPERDPATQYTPVVSGSQELDPLARVSQPPSQDPVELPLLPALRKENSIGNTSSQPSQLSDIDLDHTPDIV